MLVGGADAAKVDSEDAERSVGEDAMDARHRAETAGVAGRDAAGRLDQT